MATLQQRLASFIAAVGADYKTLRQNAIVIPSLIDRLQYGTNGQSKRSMIAHRNGRTCYPEASMEGMIACADSGFILEVDVRGLSDGTLVCVHDATVDRTMSNIATGNVNTKSVWAWKDARIVPAVQGGRTGTPLFLDEVLDRFGGRNLIMAELKDETLVTQFIAAIKARGLETSVICQSFTYSVCTQFVAAGLQALYLTSTQTAPPETWAGVKAAGINYVGPSWTVAASTVTAAKAAGLRVVGYTVTNKADTDAAWAKGFDMLFADDPWICSNQFPVQSAMPRVEFGWAGWRPIQPSGATYTEATSDIPQAVGTGIGLYSANAGAVYRTLPCDWCIPINRPYRINMDLHFGPNGTSQTGGLRFALHTNTDKNAPWLDAAVAGQNGFQFAVRRNGQAQVWQYVNGAAAANIGSTTTPATAIAPAGQEGFCKLGIEVDATGISMYLSDCPVPAAVTLANTLVLTNARLTLFWSLSDGAFENVQVVAI